ncbi:hypothetical protein NDU88_003684 [Pleurodeles waltl]|uniref:Uncharacterized protein n=1 Tax=Pleurodeles waltl TaxID=8319 RepID=A0AAV7RDT5_PLEWA|nr:hypothetical protein NDU88_003684 [Pleurodeles waltl]
MPSNPLTHLGVEGQNQQLRDLPLLKVESEKGRKRNGKPHREPRRRRREEEGEHNGETHREPRRHHE